MQNESQQGDMLRITFFINPDNFPIGLHRDQS
jgi:hypothetical protein